MSEPSADRPVAIFAGGGALPPLLAAAAAAQGRHPVVFAIAGEAHPEAFDTRPVHVLRWGEIGRLFRLLEKSGCREAAFIGSIVQRPDFRNVRPDFGAVKLIPRILQLMKAGDDGLLAGVAAIFAEQGLQFVGPLDLAPDLALPPDCVTGRMTREDAVDVTKAAEAARLIGRLDIGQAAVAAAGRVVAVEDAGGTDMLLDRIPALRQAGRIPPNGGVLVKCMKPQQDPRFDVPTLGPSTADAARRAGLNGVAAEAHRTLLAGRAETVEAFRRAGLFLCGIAAPENG
jgi:hypothetical protein